MKEISLKKNAIYNLIITVLGLIIPIITFPYFSRILLPDGMGTNSFLVSYVNYFSMFATLGIPIYAVKQCARVKDKKDDLSQNFQEIFIINLFFTFLTYIVLFISSLFIDNVYKNYNLLLYIGVGSLTGSINLNWLMQANEQYKFLSVKSIITSIITTILLFVLVRDKSHLDRYVIINQLISACSNLINLVYVKKFVFYKKSFKYNFKRHIKPIFLCFVLSAATSIYSNLDSVMLGFLKDEATVGIYTSGNKITRMTLVAVASIVTVLLPRLSHYIEQKRFEEVKVLLSRSINVIILLALPISLFLIFMGNDVILFLLGDLYEDSIIVLKLDAFIILFASLSNIIGLQYLLPLGQEYKVVISVVLGGIIDLIINFVCIPKYGVMGAAIGTVIAEITVLFVDLIWVRKDIKWLFSRVKIYNLFNIIVLTVVLYILSANLKFTHFVNLLISGIILLTFLFVLGICSGDDIVIAKLKKAKAKFHKKNADSEDLQFEDRINEENDKNTDEK